VRLPQVRFTMRRMMVAVAVAGASLGVATEANRLLRLSRSYRARAVNHVRERANLMLGRAMYSAWLAETIEERRDWRATMERWRSAPGPRVEMVIGPGEMMADWAYFERMLGNLDANIRWSASEVERSSRRLAYHDALISKYSRAALYPWLPVLTDPPEPE
jgi:hypothetical protein